MEPFISNGSDVGSLRIFIIGFVCVYVDDDSRFDICPSHLPSAQYESFVFSCWQFQKPIYYDNGTLS